MTRQQHGKHSEVECSDDENVVYPGCPACDEWNKLINAPDDVPLPPPLY